MLKLFLLRHAKSDWNICDENDFERDVSQLGLKKQMHWVSILKQIN